MHNIRTGVPTCARVPTYCEVCAHSFNRGSVSLFNCGFVSLLLVLLTFLSDLLQGTIKLRLTVCQHHVLSSSDFSSDQWLSTEVILLRGHLAMSGNIVGCHPWILISNKKRPRILSNILQCRGQGSPPQQLILQLIRSTALSLRNLGLEVISNYF